MVDKEIVHHSVTPGDKLWQDLLSGAMDGAEAEHVVVISLKQLKIALLDSYHQGRAAGHAAAVKYIHRVKFAGESDGNRKPDVPTTGS